MLSIPQITFLSSLSNHLFQLQIINCLADRAGFAHTHTPLGPNPLGQLTLKWHLEIPNLSQFHTHTQAAQPQSAQFSQQLIKLNEGLQQGGLDLEVNLSLTELIEIFSAVCSLRGCIPALCFWQGLQLQKYFCSNWDQRSAARGMWQHVLPSTLTHCGRTITQTIRHAA